jgi:hypothetical protein
VPPFEKIEALSDVDAITAAIDEQVSSPATLAPFVERFAASTRPEIACALARALTLAAACMRGPDLAPLVLQTLDRFAVEDDEARVQLLAAVQLVASHRELFNAHTSREASVARFLLDALSRSPRVQVTAIAALAWLYDDGQAARFPAELTAKLKERARALTDSDDPAVKIEIGSLERFIAS